MSLLLDALKKAAEQKAEKSREDIPEATASDETVIVPVAEDISMLEAADSDLQETQRKLQDETELDQTELPAQLENTHVESERVDETGLEAPDSTGTEIPSSSAQMRTGEDETIVFADEDVSDFLGEPELISRKTGDETDLSQLAADQTDISQMPPSEDVAGFEDSAARGDESDLSELAGDESDKSRQSPRMDASGSAGDVAREDETDISVHTPPDNTDSRVQKSTEDDTDISQSAADENMSLLLVEHDDTDFTNRTSLTDPKTLQDQTQTIQGDDSAGDEMALVDTTRHQLPDDATEAKTATQTSVTSPTGITQDTQATSTFTRVDSTSTRTYAPDNYDRTLMKLPSEDASKIFAGMKNESDAVMTPDYAKKVFRSKSSAQHLYNVKIYAGIMVAIILGIGIFGAFEFQDESNSIDTSLRPLKRDPMPGLIKSGGLGQDTNLFAEAEPAADARTIEIVESAESVAGMDEVTTGSAVIEEAVEMVEPESAALEPETEVAIVSVEQTQTTQVTDTQATSVAQVEAVASEPESSSSNLQISSTSRVGQKDILLREAYDAYKSGNDSLALTRYNQVLDEDPGNRNALLARAAINVQNGDSAAAIKDYQALLLANPTDSLAMASLITVANFSPQDTESQLKLMIRTEPGSPHLNFVLANVYGAQNRWQEAQGHYFTALQSNPGDPNYAYNLAVSLEHISQPRSAITYYRRALENFDNGLATFSKDIVDQRLELLAKK